jgi:hypothetical protein
MKTSEFENLYEINEPYIVQSFFKPPHPIEFLLMTLGINYPYCWAITNIKTNELLPDWDGTIPGDIDVIAGNVTQNGFSFENMLAIQVKVRRITKQDKLKKFVCGVGREQSAKTAELGFDRTFLLHVLVRDPKEFGEYDHPNAQWIENSDFRNFEKANEQLIIEYFKENNMTFGYGWLGWGQLYGRDFGEAGRSGFKILFRPPTLKTNNSKIREQLIKSLNQVLSENKSFCLPIVIHKKI